nr:LuxR C-terminal-related transcriptional regulator [Novosphingobium sp. SG751A]
MSRAVFKKRVAYIVDSDASYRRRFALALRHQGLETRAFSSDADLVEAASYLPAGCVLLAIRGPERSGLDTIRRLLAQRSDMPVIMMRVDPTIREAVQALRAGAVDCLPIPCPMAKVRLALDYAYEILPAKVAHQQFIGEAAALRAHLTSREEEVLKRIVGGMTNRQIALDLAIGVRTVEMHRGNIMQKLRMDNLVALIRFATLAGIAGSNEDAA